VKFKNIILKFICINKLDFNKLTKLMAGL